MVLCVCVFFNTLHLPFKAEVMMFCLKLQLFLCRKITEEGNEISERRKLQGNFFRFFEEKEQFVNDSQRTPQAMDRLPDLQRRQLKVRQSSYPIFSKFGGR